MALASLVAGILSIEHEKRLLVFDMQGFADVFPYPKLLAKSGFHVIEYEDVEAFRLLYEQEIKGASDKWAVVVKEESYIPYDVHQSFYPVRLSISEVFPHLDSLALQSYIRDLDLISFAYREDYIPKLSAEGTRNWIKEKAFSPENVKSYMANRSSVLKERIMLNSAGPIGYLEWMKIAQVKATLEVYGAMTGLYLDAPYIDEAFEKYVLGDYQLLAGQANSATPVILPKVLDFIEGDRVALIVLDGMSLFDFAVLSRHFGDIEYEFRCSFALIPTTTAISRQSLLTGKYPRELEDSFTSNKEEGGFYQAMGERGYTKNQVAYIRGYDVQPGPFTKFLAVILNDVDDIVHGQQQGRRGMYNDMTLLAKTGKIQNLIRSLNEEGFSVYLTSDHGNTACKGVGLLRTGVEVETRAKRMMVLKDFAQAGEKVAASTITYPAYYLDKNYLYLICGAGICFESNERYIMAHGGASIDEVIVPFVKIKAAE